MNITVDRAVIEQALEALENVQGLCTDANDGWVEAVTIWTPEAITALRAALEQPQQEHIIDCPRCGHCCPQQPVQEPVQEPVAWRNAALRVGEDLSSVGPDGYYDMTAEQWLDWAIDQQPRGKNSLNASPQRKPLTDEEILDCWKQAYEPGRREHDNAARMARAIEAAHGIKGEAC